jgi:anti-sigma B factor antagonist
VFEVQYEATPEYDLCRPVGDLDSSTAPQLREELGRHPSPSRLIVDLSQVPFIDSAGLGALIGGIRRVREDRGDVALAGPRREVMTVLRTTGFDRMLPVTATVADAAAALADDTDAGRHRSPA